VIPTKTQIKKVFSRVGSLWGSGGHDSGTLGRSGEVVGTTGSGGHDSGTLGRSGEVVGTTGSKGGAVGSTGNEGTEWLDRIKFTADEPSRLERSKGNMETKRREKDESFSSSNHLLIFV
jgi:hypothetical protein